MTYRFYNEMVNSLKFTEKKGKQQKKMVKMDGHTHTTEARWVELFSL